MVTIFQLQTIKSAAPLLPAALQDHHHHPDDQYDQNMVVIILMIMINIIIFVSGLSGDHFSDEDNHVSRVT